MKNKANIQFIVLKKIKYYKAIRCLFFFQMFLSKELFHDTVGFCVVVSISKPKQSILPKHDRSNQRLKFIILIKVSLWRKRMIKQGKEKERQREEERKSRRIEETKTMAANKRKVCTGFSLQGSSRSYQ